MTSTPEPVTIETLGGDLVDAIRSWQDDHPNEGTDHIDLVITDLIKSLLRELGTDGLANLVASDPTLAARTDPADYLTPSDAWYEAVDEALREHVEIAIGEELLAAYENLPDGEETP